MPDVVTVGPQSQPMLQDIFRRKLCGILGFPPAPSDGRKPYASIAASAAGLGAENRTTSSFSPSFAAAFASNRWRVCMSSLRPTTVPLRLTSATVSRPSKQSSRCSRRSASAGRSSVRR